MARLRRGSNRRFSRRSFLRRLTALGTLGLTAGCGDSLPPVATAGGAGPVTGMLGGSFKHGVASGDPLSDRVLLWTRYTPPVEGRFAVRWVVARDPALSSIVSEGLFDTDTSRDYTVKVDVTGLAPNTSYYYRFMVGDMQSPIGRARTLPVAGATLERLRFGAVTCTSFGYGFFNALGRLAERHDLAFCVHMGDYIYEYADGEYGDVRRVQPVHEITTLADYRARHAWYRLDPDLAEWHRQQTTVHLWDDHDSANNSWRDGAGNHTEATDGAWTDRKAAAIKAWREWLPVRDDDADPVKIWRRFVVGDLLDCILIDTRLYDRDAQEVSPSNYGNPALKLIGPVQRAFLASAYADSTAVWKGLFSASMLAQYKAVGSINAINGGGVYPYNDQWDGYQAERDQLLALVAADARKNTVVISGDLHGSLACDVCNDPNNPQVYNATTGAGSIAVEFVVNSVTSPGDLDSVAPSGTANTSEGAVKTQNPHIKYFDLDQRGFSVFDVSRTAVQGEWWFVDTVLAPSTAQSFATAWKVLVGSTHLVAATESASLPLRTPAP